MSEAPDMAVLVTCHCGRSFHAPDSDAGGITHCPDCGRDLTVPAAPEAAPQSLCVNNLKQIGLAMYNFHVEEGHFPPAAITDSNGKPLLSWRVAILPYIEQDSLYRKFKLDEPWDSPHHRSLLAEMPPVFACPSDQEPKSFKTRYQAITGPGTIFEGNEGMPVSAILDGVSNTLMIIEANDPVEWTKPDDQPFGPNLPLPVLGSGHPGGANALFADGTVRFLKTTIHPVVLGCLITRAGGEIVAVDSF
jgi:prepilin-type processing-associated H-X9-DG protein